MNEIKVTREELPLTSYHRFFTRGYGVSLAYFVLVAIEGTFDYRAAEMLDYEDRGRLVDGIPSIFEV